MKKEAPVFTMWIVVLIVGAALYKQIDFKTMTVEKQGLSVIYAMTLIFAAVVLIRHYTRKN
ncbi:MAG: hypothetical protein E2590_11375 [Chryseobacterium sp.]|nr:hypothetical protein [Chryseobacterium sp.]